MIFEVGLHNKFVRSAMRTGSIYPKNIDESWEDTRYIEVEALSESHCRLKVEYKYPKNEGFMVETIDELK